MVSVPIFIAVAAVIGGATVLVSLWTPQLLSVHTTFHHTAAAYMATSCLDAIDGLHVLSTGAFDSFRAMIVFLTTHVYQLVALLQNIILCLGSFIRAMCSLDYAEHLTEGIARFRQASGAGYEAASSLFMAISLLESSIAAVAGPDVAKTIRYLLYANIIVITNSVLFTIRIIVATGWMVLYYTLVLVLRILQILA